jgi:hypothetical protein
MDFCCTGILYQLRYLPLHAIYGGIAGGESRRQCMRGREREERDTACNGGPHYLKYLKIL